MPLIICASRKCFLRAFGPGVYALRAGFVWPGDLKSLRAERTENPGLQPDCEHLFDLRSARVSYGLTASTSHFFFV